MTGPWVRMALFCEGQAEKTDTLSFPELIGVCTHVYAPAEPGYPEGRMSPTELKRLLVVQLVADGAFGKVPISVISYTPDGEVISRTELEPSFAGVGTTGIRVRIDWVIEQTGVYWVEVRTADRILTRAPLEVQFA